MLLTGTAGQALRDVVARRRVVFVGGKGGVGKTTVASALALAQARTGRRVLLVSTDPAHNLGHLWERAVGDTPVRLAGPDDTVHLDGVEVDPQRTTDAHLHRVGATLRRLMPERLAGEVDRHLNLARDAPGTHEAAVLERIADAVEDGLERYDLVVFDTAPSGHTARLMALPETMSAWTEGLLRRQERSARFGAALRGLGGDDRDDGGLGAALVGRADPRADRDSEIRQVLLRRRRRFEMLREVLTDPERTAFVLVLAAERLPVLETVELHAQLVRLGVHVAGLVVNKRSPADAGQLLAARRAQEEEHLRVLDRELPGHLQVQVDLQVAEVVGADALARFAGA